MGIADGRALVGLTEHSGQHLNGTAARRSSQVRGVVRPLILHSGRVRTGGHGSGTRARPMLSSSGSVRTVRPSLVQRGAWRATTMPAVDGDGCCGAGRLRCRTVGDARRTAGRRSYATRRDGGDRCRQSRTRSAALVRRVPFRPGSRPCPGRLRCRARRSRLPTSCLSWPVVRLPERRGRRDGFSVERWPADGDSRPAGWTRIGA